MYNAAPAAAGITCTISGNGSHSSSDCKFEVKNDTNVLQSNKADIDNKVQVDASTGGNQAEDNTGGDVTIETGDVDVSIAVENQVNSNVAKIDGYFGGDYTAEITGNGTDSDNEVEFEVENEIDLTQKNKADVDNKVKVDAETGDNDAEDNTGGSVHIDTGDVDVDKIDIKNVLNANSATVEGTGSDTNLFLKIAGNGSDTDNEIDVDLDTDVTIFQKNKADVDNDVDVDASTGDNEAEDNTGEVDGDPSISTGDVTVDVSIMTAANANAADVTGGADLGDVEIMVDGNGTDSDNEVELELDDDLDLTQRNRLEAENEVEDIDVETGDNDADDNTGGSVNIETGDTDAHVEVSTTGNANVFGDVSVHDAEFDDILELLEQIMELLGLE
jgi:hypothetical protein